jgi:hypothetical protein
VGEGLGGTEDPPEHMWFQCDQAMKGLKGPG